MIIIRNADLISLSMIENIEGEIEFVFIAVINDYIGLETGCIFYDG